MSKWHVEFVVGSKGADDVDAPTRLKAMERIKDRYPGQSVRITKVEALP